MVARLRAAGCVFAEDEAELLLAAAAGTASAAGVTPAARQELLDQLVRRRVAGEPLEHVVGWAEFCDLRVAVDPAVFVPRRRTEFLVTAATGLAPARGAVVVDLCCGAGAIGLALATALTDVELHAADIEPAAVACARRNIEPLGGTTHTGDLYAALPAHLAGRVDILAVNAPYVPTGEIRLLPPEARDHEPHIALDGGTDGLTLHRHVAADATHWLAPGGHLLIETSEHQALATASVFAVEGLRARVVTCEELYATVVVVSAL